MNNHFVTTIEYNLQKVIFTSVFFLILFDIFSKLITGYNRAIAEEILKSAVHADGSISFDISDCFKVFNNYAFFVLFSMFILLTSWALRKHTKNYLFPLLSLCFLLLSILQATYLSFWFTQITGIEWNSSFIQNSLIEIILYILFFILSFIYLKIIYRFVKAKYHAKISLR